MPILLPIPVSVLQLSRVIPPILFFFFKNCFSCSNSFAFPYKFVEINVGVKAHAGILRIELNLHITLGRINTFNMLSPDDRFSHLKLDDS